MGGERQSTLWSGATHTDYALILNTGGQTIGAQMTNASTGADFTGTVTVYVTIDGGTQTIGSVGGGICTPEGHGYYSYKPSQAETNGQLLAFTFTGSNAISVTIQDETLSSQQQTAIANTAGSGSILVSELITDALRRINVIQEGQSPTAAALADAFRRFNDFVDSVCGNDELLVYKISRATWNLTSSKGTLANPYTVGNGGDININRPAYLPDGAIRYQNLAVTPTLEYPLTSLTNDAWRLVPQKDLTNTLPTSYYYTPSFESGYAQLYLWMVPTQANLQGVIYYPAQVTRFATLNDTIALPPGYNRFLRDNLAVELSSEFRENIPIDPMLVQNALQSKALLKRKNEKMSDMQIDAGLLPTRRALYNIFSDTSGR